MEIFLKSGSKRCRSINPETGKQCTSGLGHFGCHKVGDQYHPDEAWVVKCKDEHPVMLGKRKGFCNYHEHLDGTASCIYCGHKVIVIGHEEYLWGDPEVSHEESAQSKYSE